MNPPRAPAPRRQTFFTFGAVLAVLAGLAVGTWLRPAATTVEVPAPPAAVAPSELLAGTPAHIPAVEPAPPTDAAPGNLAEAQYATDLARLRARQLTIPVAGFSAGQLADNYSQTRAGGAAHEALDLMAARGTPVLAVEDGQVAKLFLSQAGGITLYQFDPGSNFAYYYAHLDAYAEGMAEGASLRKGQVIGYVGSSGNASPDAPHLHFAIFKLGAEKQWWRGTPLNPFLVWRDARP